MKFSTTVFLLTRGIVVIFGSFLIYILLLLIDLNNSLFLPPIVASNTRKSFFLPSIVLSNFNKNFSSIKVIIFLNIIIYISYENNFKGLIILIICCISDTYIIISFKLVSSLSLDKLLHFFITYSKNDSIVKCLVLLIFVIVSKNFLSSLSSSLSLSLSSSSFFSNKLLLFNICNSFLIILNNISVLLNIVLYWILLNRLL